MFGLFRIKNKNEATPAVEVMDVDRAIERFENDEEVIHACTELSAILFYQSTSRAVGDDLAVSREQEDLTNLLAQKGVRLESSDISQFVSALSAVDV